MAVNLIYLAVGAALGWLAAMFVAWLHDEGILDFLHARFLDESGESL